MQPVRSYPLARSIEETLFVQETFDWALEQCKGNRWKVLKAQEENLAELNRLGVSLLGYVVEQGEETWCKHLIDHRIDIHSVDLEGNTPLHRAAKEGACSMLEYLCKVIEIDVKNNKGQTPLHLAIEYGQPQFVQQLLQKKADPYQLLLINKFSFDALGLAVKQGEKECIAHLMPTHKPKFLYPHLGSLLHIAIYFHQAEALEYLLENYKNNFEIEGRNQDQLTPLSFAASLGGQECLKLLCHHKASIKAKDANGRLPIHHAASGCHGDTIQLLAALGSKIEPADNKRKRPIDLVGKRNTNPLRKNCKDLLIHLSQDPSACQLLPRPKLTPPTNLVFKGGGAKGIAYVGALVALNEEKILERVERVAGTSAGAITSSLLAVAYPLDKLQELLKKTDLASILLDHPFTKEKIKDALSNATKDVSSVINTLLSISKTCAQPWKVISTPLKELYRCTGICEGEKFRNWFEAIIKEQTGIEFFTFGELAEAIKNGKPYKHLHVYGTKMSSSPEIVHIHSESPEWKDVIISDAIRLSMSIPGVFKPHMIHIKQQGKRIPVPERGSFLDGGMLYNFPVETFDRKKFLTREDLGQDGDCPKYNKQTLGFNLYSSNDAKPVNQDPETLTELLSGICKIYFHAEGAIRNLNPYHTSRVIGIDVKEIGTLSFNMTDLQKTAMVDSGKDCTQAFLQRHHLIQGPRLTLLKIDEVAFGITQWEKYYGKVDQIPVPPLLQKLWNQPCPIYPNKKTYETHMIALIPSLLNGKKFNFKQFIENNPFSLEEGLEVPSHLVVDKPYWILMTRDTIPECYKKTYDERCQLLLKYPGYEPPKLIEAAICASFEQLVNKQQLFSDSAPTWMRWTQVLEKADGDHICLGNSDKEGMKIFAYPGKAYGGIAAVRRFM